MSCYHNIFAWRGEGMKQPTVTRQQAIVSIQQWMEYQTKQYNMFPYVTTYKLDAHFSPIPSWEAVWTEAEPHAFILESGKGGRYTMIGLKPTSIIRGKDRQATITHMDGTEEKCEGDPLAMIKTWFTPYRAPRISGAPKFIGGCVGYISYDIVRSIERLPVQAEDDLQLPDFIFMQMNELWVIDQEENVLYCAVTVDCTNQKSICVGNRQVGQQTLPTLYHEAERRAVEMKKQWDAWWAVACGQQALQDAAQRRTRVQQVATMHTLPELRTPFPQEDFEAAVRRIQDYIRQGDVFQVNLSLRQMHTVYQSAEQLYEWVRVLNPSPYMGMLRFPDFQFVSCSPELLVRLEQDQVIARPIAGTRRRGRNEAEDKRMEEQLCTDEKERAEHIMLVDLERNDISRVAQFGTVQVDELMTVEYYSHVMHLVSEVRGILAAGKDALDVLRATFPGGTITGAPKVRTMEIIEELEPVRRGPYTGSFGWISYDGDMEFNIMIRTVTMKDNVAHIQAGAGIVIDSDPKREYQESMNKAKALWLAVQFNEQHTGAFAVKKGSK